MGDRALPEGDFGPRFEARCSWCGPVDLESGDLEVHVGAGTEALVEFECPQCSRLNVRALDLEDVEALAAAGVVPVIGGSAPFELLEERSGPPIGWDDLIDFHEWIARRDSRLGELERGGRGRNRQERDAA